MITVAEVRKFTEQRAAEDAYVGLCSNATACLVAEAILDKYPQYHNVWVGWGGEFDLDLAVRASESARPANFFEAPAAWIGDHNDPEVAKLIKLIKAFDRLEYWGEVPAKAVLRIFEDEEKPAVQVDTGFNQFEGVPQGDEDDDDLPFDDADDEDEIFEANDDILDYDEDWDDEWEDEDDEEPAEE